MVSLIDDAELRWLYSHCRALVAPSYEDFGLTPVEAASFGKPTVALRAGGYLDRFPAGRIDHVGVSIVTTVLPTRPISRTGVPSLSSVSNTQPRRP